MVDWKSGLEIAIKAGAEWLPPDEGRAFPGAIGLSCGPALKRDSLYGVFPEYFIYNQWFSEAQAVETVRREQPLAVLASAPIPGFYGGHLLYPEPRRLYALLARWWADCPDKQLAMIGVTGTNGKTTTARLLAHLLDRLDGPSASRGTLGTELSGLAWEPGEFTTGLAGPTFETLAQLVEAGARSCVMEVSSHGLALDRVEGIQFRGAILTNLTRDHLDFHETQSAYVAAKRRLFEQLEASAWAVLNADDPYVREFSEATRARVSQVGLSPHADWRVERVEAGVKGSEVEFSHDGRRYAFSTSLVGRFQIANVMAAMAAAHALGHAIEAIVPHLQSFIPAPGRMETVALASGGLAVIDFAHNPDGLRNLLLNCRELKPRRLLLVFGCGGDRDRGKRPLMAEMAAAQADRIWVTADNPRTESLERIFEDINRGFPDGAPVRLMDERGDAIAEAWTECEAGDLLVLAGKGHEDYQIVGTEKIPFSDRGTIDALEESIRRGQRPAAL